MKKVVIVGGGISGLTSAVYLSEKSFDVTLVEASPKLGGRAYSLYNEEFDDYYDNGQHIMMGCYEETISLQKKINSFDKIFVPQSLEINFIGRDNVQYDLKAAKHGYPLNLLFAILKYRAISFKERLKIIDLFLDLMCCFEEDLNELTVADWLKCKRQSDNSIKSFWEILVVGALNTTIDKASALVFTGILKRIFLQGNFASIILLPKTDLSDLFCRPSINFLQTRNGKVLLSQRITGIRTSDGFIKCLESEKGTITDFDAVIFAIPPHALEKITIDNVPFQTPDLKYSSILNVHLWLSSNPFAKKFYGFIGSDIHWLFNHKKHISLTSSSADSLIPLDNDKLKRHLCAEIEKYFPLFHRSMVLDSKIIKERRATFIPDISSIEIRKNFLNRYGNLFFAGDWVDTGLPSTIESAVVSGKTAAEKIISSLMQ
jgi:squalene-associated FAD-dependent desaturase